MRNYEKMWNELKEYLNAGASEDYNAFKYQYGGRSTDTNCFKEVLEYVDFLEKAIMNNS